MHVGVFQALPGRSRRLQGLQGPPGASRTSRTIEGPPGASRGLQDAPERPEAGCLGEKNPIVPTKNR